MKNKILELVMLFMIGCFHIESLAAVSNDQILLVDNSLVRKNHISDINTTATIKRKFIEDNEISSLDIRVKTEDGNVTLTGSVPNSEVKERIISIANSTKGVKDVDAQITVNKSTLIKNVLSDSRITSIIKLKLLEDESLSGIDIQVKTINAKVTLTGFVPNEDSRKRAIHIAEVTNGVKEVESKLEIEKAGPTKNFISDSAITASLKLNLLEDEHLSGLDIHVETINGKVILTGSVPDEASVERAVSIAKVTNGVKNVTSKLSIEKK